MERSAVGLPPLMGLEEVSGSGSATTFYSTLHAHESLTTQIG